MRIFLAFTLPPQLEKGLVRLQKGLAEVHSHLRWTRRENLHATLLFIGSVEGGLVSRLEEKLTQVAAAHSPIRFRFVGLEMFPHCRPRVLSLKLEELSPPRLPHLQRDLVKELKEIDIEPAPPKPLHLTLARFPRSYEGRVEKLTLGEGLSDWKVGSFSIIESNLTPRGPIYTELASISFSSL